MDFQTQRRQFAEEKKIYDSALLTFSGIDGYDVYNCSVPFSHKGETYLFGRVEKRGEWARSRAMLFRKTGPDAFALAEGGVYPLEDPFVSRIGDEWVLGGTHVRYECGKYTNYWGYFYKGNDLADLDYFTTGPDHMKDIRLVQLPEGIGVFSRPRGPEILQKYGSESIVGFTVIKDLLELSPERIQAAPLVEGLFADGEWGGCNQCYLLANGQIGVIGHKSCLEQGADGQALQVYVNMAFVVDPVSRRCVWDKILATRDCYPAGPAKTPGLVDCAFPSGLVLRPDGRADLYSGLGDTMEGRVTIDDPFTPFGGITEPAGLWD